MKLFFTKTTKVLIYALIFFSTESVLAQIPIDCNKFYLHSPPTIYSYDPLTSTYVTNPISCPAGGGGLAVSNNLNSGSPSVTFYTIVSGQYWYYNGSSWVNTGHSCLSSSAVNIGGAGPYVYNLDGLNSKVYRYNGTGNDVLVLTLASWGGPYDLIGDDYGNFYILFLNSGNQKLVKYSPSGAVLCTYSLISAPVATSGAGYAIVNNKLYMNAGSSNYVGTISGTTITFSGLAGLPSGMGDFASCPFPQLSSGISNPTNLNCSILSTQLTVTTSVTGPTYSWSGPGITSGAGTNAVTVNQPGIYTVIVTGSGGACPGASTSTINVTQSGVPPSVFASSGGVLTCSNFNVTLSGSSGSSVNYSWSGPGIVSGATSANPIVNQPGTYNLTVTDPSSGCSSSTVINVSSNTAPPSVFASSGSVLTCSNLNVTLSGSSGSSVNYSWSGPGIVSGATSANPVVNQPGTYNLTVTNPSNGCSTNTAISVSQNISPPSASASAASGSLLTCTITSLSLTGSPSSGVTYNWSGPGIISGGSTANPTVNQPGTYNLVVTDNSNGCSNASSPASVVITQNITNPSATASAPAGSVLSCSVTTLMLNGTPASGVTYNWSGLGIISGGSTANPTVNQAGTYNLIVTDNSNGCSNASSPASVVITQNATIPSATASAPAGSVLSCSVTSLILNGTPSSGVTYNWSGPGIISGGNTANPTINQPGTYNLIVTDNSNGCSNTSSPASVVITQNATIPSVTASTPAGSALTCSVTTLILNGTPSSGVTYNWSGPGIISGGNTANPTVNQPGTYNLVVTDNSNGCSNASSPASVVITQNTTIPSATASASAGSVLTCSITSLVLNGTPSSGVTYNWSGPGIISGGNTANPTVNQPGTYNLTVTDNASGCSSPTPAVLTVSQNTTAPNVTSSTVGSSSITCAVTTVTLNASPTNGVTYSWTGPGIISGSNTSNPIVNQAGNYSVTVTDNSTGCSNVLGSTGSVVNVFVDTTAPIAQINTATAGSITCTNNMVTINASASSTGANITYTWTTNGTAVITGSSSTMPSVTSAGIYSLTVTNTINGCTNTASINITSNTTLPAGVYAGGSVLLPCDSGSVILKGLSTSGNVSYTWTGPNNYNFAGQNTNGVTTAGTYTLLVTDNINGCSVTDTVTVINQSVVAGFTSDQNTGTTPLPVNFTNTSLGAASFVWNFNDGNTSSLTNPSNLFQNQGTYTVVMVAFNSAGTCSSVATVVITVEDPFLLEVPNVFTPNGDGVNDVFTIKSKGVKDITLQIFNRWGQKMYEFSGVKAAWDGLTSQGIEVPDATYFYFIKASSFDGKIVEQQGTVNLFK